MSLRFTHAAIIVLIAASGSAASAPVTSGAVDSVQRLDMPAFEAAHRSVSPLDGLTAHDTSGIDGPVRFDPITLTTVFAGTRMKAPDLLPMAPIAPPRRIGPPPLSMALAPLPFSGISPAGIGVSALLLSAAQAYRFDGAGLRGLEVHPSLQALFADPSSGDAVVGGTLNRVPTPSAIVLALSGLASGVLLRWRRARSAGSLAD